MNNKGKQVSIVSLIIVIIIASFSYLQLNDYTNNKRRLYNIQENIKMQESNYIKTIFKEERKMVKKAMDIHVINIQKELYDYYGKDLDGLDRDIKNPSPNSKLSKVFDNCLYDFYVNKNTKINKQFVLSNNKLLWGRCFSFKKPYNSLSIEDLLDLDNNDLNKEAIQTILANDDMDKFIFWENNNSKKIKEMDIKSLINLYHEKGLFSMKNYELLIPTYITPDGDIFGIKDVDSLGHKIDNYKMIIVQRVNIYDILETYSSELSAYQSQYEEMEIEINNNNANKKKSALLSISMILVVIFTSAYLQNRKYK